MDANRALELSQSIGRLEGKVDLLIDMHGDTKDRVGKMEKRVWWTTGGAAVLVSMFLSKTGLTHLLGP